MSCGLSLQLTFEFVATLLVSLRKHGHVIYRNFFGFKNENFHRKKKYIFLIFAENIDCGYTLEPPRRGGSNEYPQSMFWSKNKKNRYTPAYPSFAILNWGLRGYSLHGHVFLVNCNLNFYELGPGINQQFLQMTGGQSIHR